MAIPPPSNDSLVLVTGASSGIGTEFARQFAERGHAVGLVARRADRLEELAEEVGGAGGDAEVFACDLADREARAELPARLDAAGRHVDVLVNNAGFSTFGAVTDADPDAELQMVEVDVAAVTDLTTRFLPGMVERGRGGILNVASTAAFQPIPGQAAYAASKAFVLSYTRSLAGELRGSGVSVAALCPGPVDTGFVAAAGIEQSDAEAALPNFMWEPADAVARVGVDALESGTLAAIPGRANQATAMLAQITPKRLLVPLLAARHPGLRKRGS